MVAAPEVDFTDFTEAEGNALVASEHLSCSEWATRYREIVAKDAAEPGPWQHERAPYLVEIMDACTDPDVQEVVLIKAARVGGSEVTRNAMACWIDQTPGPILLVYPTEPSASEQLVNEIRPLLTKLPRLARHLSARGRDLTNYELDLIPCRIYTGWAGSPQTLASRTIQYFVGDEVDKWPVFSGREAAPLDLARRRITTYGDRGKAVITSTPTTRTGAIWREWEASVDRRHYHVPCPRCGSAQPLTFALLKWTSRPNETKQETANRLEVERDVWYQCRDCGGRIDEHEKRDMLLAGQWVSEGHDPGQHPRSHRRAYHISGLYSLLGLTWAKIAAQWVSAQGDLEKMMEVITQVFGEPFEDQLGSIEKGALDRKVARGATPGVVPKWAATLLLTADTQADHFWWILRAWGRGEKSRQIGRGKAVSFADLERILDGWYPVEGSPHVTMQPQLVVIDAAGGGDAAENQHAKSRTDEVYRWCQADPARRIPLQSWGGDGAGPSTPFQQRKIEYTPKGQKSLAYEVVLYVIDSQHFKDVLAARIRADDNTWELSDIDDEYRRHMEAEHKIAIRKGKKLIPRWVVRSYGRRNDQWDGEVYQVFAGKLARTHLLPDEAELERERAAHKHPAPPRKPGKYSTTPDGRPFLARRT